MGRINPDASGKVRPAAWGKTGSPAVLEQLGR